MIWRKTRFPASEAAQFEADGLRWLGAVPDGVRVATVHDVAPGVLELEEIRSGPAPRQAAAAFGGALARTHAAGAQYYGQTPGSTGGYMGQAALPPAPRAGDEPMGWSTFYAEHRVLPFLRRAVDQGEFSRADAAVVEGVAARLSDGELDHPQPALVGEGPARLHGDLWSGNVLWDARAGGEAVLIDPTAHGGHAETDLAMLALFGQQHLETILAGYQEISPLAQGWSERIELHQVNPLLVHTVLFGGSYAGAAVAAARRYV